MSDEAPHASRGPSRDKSLGVEATSEHGSGCDGPSAETGCCPRTVSGKSLKSFGRGSNGTIDAGPPGERDSVPTGTAGAGLHQWLYIEATLPPAEAGTYKVYPPYMDQCRWKIRT